jgi:hypothetical protein
MVWDHFEPGVSASPHANLACSASLLLDHDDLRSGWVDIELGNETSTTFQRCGSVDVTLVGDFVRINRGGFVHLTHGQRGPRNGNSHRCIRANIFNDHGRTKQRGDRLPLGYLDFVTAGL